MSANRTSGPQRPIHTYDEALYGGNTATNPVGDAKNSDVENQSRNARAGLLVLWKVRL
ncbi:MAG: hypothetical protein WB543_19060 [Candidatus Acidiferrum sp.]